MLYNLLFLKTFKKRKKPFVPIIKELLTDELSETDKDLLMESKTEYEKGKLITHASLIQEFKKNGKEIVWTDQKI